MSSGLPIETQSEPVPARSGPALPLSGGPTDPVKPGQRWANRYEVKAAVGEPGGHWYDAVDTEEGAAVLLRVTRASRADGRAAVWQKIQALASPHLQRPLAVHEAGERVEVWAALRGQTLRSWRLTGGVPDQDRLHAMIRQLTAALEALHYAGVGHFSLNADTVYVHEGGSGPVVILGGFETAVLNEGSALIAIPVDPFTAPPEAAGLFQHAPGEMLRGWDWWSLGRLIQELLLGCHVAGILPEGPKARTLPAGAAALLTEREIPRVRAGAVELMPDLDQRLTLLLRGLLATAVTGRWGAQEVKEWLAGGQPPERYAASRHELYFRHNGRGYTVPEFARILHAAPDPAEAVSHFFGTEEKDTLACFLKESPAHTDFDQRLLAARGLTGAVALRQFAEPLRKEVAAAVAWHGLAGGGFFWRGQALTEAGLRVHLGVAKGFGPWRASLLALATPLVLNYITVYDSEAVRLLERMVRTAEEAEAVAVKSRWLKPAAPAAQAALWQAALEPDARLLAARVKLHGAYGASDDAAFQAVFTAEKPTRVMQVLLAWAESDPPAFQLVTHRELRLRRQQSLLQEGTLLTRMIFWLRLDRAMRAGPWLFGGRWFLILAGMVLVSLLAVHLPGPWGVALGLVPLVVLAAARLAINRAQARLVLAWSPDSPPWDWRAGPDRSVREVQALARQPGVPAIMPQLQAALKRVRADLAQLASENEPVVYPPQPPRHAATWSVVALGWLVVLGLVAGSLKWGLAHPPSWKLHATAWQGAPAKEKKGPKEVRPGDIKITWPYKVPEDAFEITVKGSFTPTARQVATAIRRGKEFALPYKPETISSLIALYLPLEDGQGGPDAKGGLLLFDGKKGTMFSRTGMVINFVPLPRSGLLIGDQAAFFIER